MGNNGWFLRRFALLYHNAFRIEKSKPTKSSYIRSRINSLGDERGMRKKAFSLIILILIISSFFIQSFATNTESTPNTALLDAMLYGNRHWVIETLVDDSRVNNPMAIKQATSHNQSMAREALNTYRGIDANGQTVSSLYKSMIDIMEKIYSSDEYINGLVDEAGNLLSWLAGWFTGKSEVEETIDDLTASTDELRYESLLKAIFSEKYTASDGTTLGESESTLVLVRQIKDAVSYMNKFISVGRAQASAVVGAANLTAFDAEYIDKYAMPYIDAGTKFMTSLSQLQNGDESKDAASLAEAAACLATIGNLAVMAPADSFMGYSYHDYLAGYLVDDGVIEVLSTAGKTLNIAETSLEGYLYINSIQGQKESFAGGVERLSEFASEEDLKKAISYFSDMLSDEYDTNLLSYDSIIRYLRENNTTSSTVVNGSKKLFSKLYHISETSLASAAASRAVAVADITMWVADQAIGLKDTCKKTYELLCLEDITNLCIEMYNADVAEYQAEPSDENAAVVLDDLMILQKVRLYGEKVAYGISAGQIDSLIGQIIWGGETADSLKLLYQTSIDALIAASVIPPMDGVTVETDDIITIDYDERTGYTGIINRGGKLIYLPELSSQLAGGLTVNGTLGITGYPGIPLGISYLSASPGATVGVVSGQVMIDELYCPSGTVNVTLTNDATLKITGEMNVANCVYSSRSNSPMEVCNLYLRGSFTGGELLVSGNITADNGTVETLHMQSDTGQIISGKLSCDKLNVSGTSLDVQGQVTVTEELSSPATEVVNGKNILLDGGILTGSIFNGDLSTQNVSLSGDTIKGSLYDSGSTIYSGSVVVEGNLSLSENPNFSAGSAVMVHRAVDIACESISGVCALSVGGDVSVAGDASLSELNMCGSVPQEIVGNLTAETVVLDNPKGIKIDGEVTARKTLTQLDNGAITGDPMILGDGGVLTDNSFVGNLSVHNCILDGTTKIDGDLTIQDGGTVSGGSLTITGKMQIEETAAFSGTSVTAGLLNSNGSITSDGPINVNGTANCGGTIDTTSYVTIAGDLISDSLTCNGEIRVKGDITGTLTSTVLVLDGRYRQNVYGTVRTTDLFIRNTSTSGVNIEGDIYASANYQNTGAPVSGNPIHVGEGGFGIEADTTLSGDQSIDGALTLDGNSLKIDGSLTVTDGISLKSATLLITGNLTVSGGGISVDENSLIIVGKQAHIRASGISQNGEMTIGSDLYISDAAMSGQGVLTLKGDLQSGGAITQDKLILSGLVRQYIDAGSVSVQDVELRNNSNGGVYLISKISYSNSLDTGSTVVTNEQNFVKEAA